MFSVIAQTTRKRFPWIFQSVQITSSAPVTVWRLIFGAEFHSACSASWTERGAYRCPKRGRCSSVDETLGDAQQQCNRC